LSSDSLRVGFFAHSVIIEKQRDQAVIAVRRGRAVPGLDDKRSRSE